MTNGAYRCLLALLTLLVSLSCASVPKRQVKPVLRQQDWVSYDGKVMPWKEWPVQAGVPLKGIVIAVHGLSGATSDFWFMGEKLPPQSYAVYSYELRGQGKDPFKEERGDITSSNAWIRDLETFHRLVSRRHPKTPIYWYGESLGSLICLHTVVRGWGGRNDPDALILASPVAGLRMTVSGFKRWLLETASKLAPKTRFSLGDLAGVDEKKIQVTSTTTHGSQMAQTEHHISSFSLRLLAEIGGMMDENTDAAHSLRLPVLFLASPNDVLSSPDQVQSLFGEVRSRDKRLLWYTKSYHLLLHDVQKEEVVKDLLQWLGKRPSKRR